MFVQLHFSRFSLGDFEPKSPTGDNHRSFQLRCRKNGAGRRGAPFTGFKDRVEMIFFVLVVVISRTTWLKKMNIHFCWCCLCELFIFVGVLTARFRMSVVFC